MACIDFISRVHTRAERDYLQRVTEHDKAACASVAKKFGREYWDGDRRYGYGGYRYDGRWEPVARDLIAHYGLTAGQRVLDVGCGKGFLLHELKLLQPGLEVSGIDLSRYAIEHAKEEVRPYLREGRAETLPYPDDHFDLVISLNVLHNLHIHHLAQALQEIERVKRGASYIVVESYRNEREKSNLLYWQLTCECFFTPGEWEWIFETFGYTGDYSFIYFE